MKIQQTFKKARIASAFATATLVSVMSATPLVSHAEESQELPGSLYRSVQGSSYWTTSNLREWLNSDEQQVRYTNQAPTSAVLGNYAYDKEAGFLTNFTGQELEGIAVTEHRVYLASPDSITRTGGSFQVVSNIYAGSSLSFALPGILNNYNNYLYKNEKDKMFLLNDYDLYQYIQKRGWSVEKTLTPEAKTKNSYYSNSINWFINGPTENIGNEQTHTANTDDSVVRNEYPKNPRGVAPAFHLKPTTTVDGKQAKDLKIGEKVDFGRYLGSPITWVVINKTVDGFPLLVADQIIDIKPYDAPGDAFSYSHSDSIGFAEEDISMSSNTEYQSIDESSDITIPSVQVLNKIELDKRQNGEFTLELNVSDSQSGIDKVILPDGNVIRGTDFNYTISTNKDYLFKIYDKAGNVRYFTIPVGNINPPSSVVIESSANGWTNKDVTVNIFASNDVGFQRTELIQGGRDMSPYSFPNFTSYTGKKFRISGTVELVQATKEVGNLTANIGFYYHTRYESNGEYNANYRWQVMKAIPLRELQANGETAFDFETTIPGDYYKNLVAWTQMGIPSAERSYTLKWRNLKYELIDNDDFGISKIILPSGTAVMDNHYTDTLKEEGVYTYKVLDNRGMTTEKDITVLIDKTSPTLTADYPQIWTRDPVTLHVSASDSQSGVKEITLPNGSKTSQLDLTYTIRTNGTYTFSVTDNAGNITTKHIVVSHIDTSNPTAPVISANENWTKDTPVMVSISTGADNLSGVKQIEYKVKGKSGKGWIPYTGAFPVSEEGETVVLARTVDNVWNISPESQAIVRIDKSPTYNNQITIHPQ